MRQIEHKIIDCLKDEIEANLRTMEQGGWEIATIFDDSNENPQAENLTYHLVFKRKT